ncbi:MAG: helix-turn-helix transcriptional regulator [Candidatus Gastranaerophilales bacterium]|nr:helix-turn-helix transcriptional regulator [Candidatus Gastranaerophilales bacterium]
MKEITVENILNTLKTLRESMGISQAQAAKAAGISTSFYGMLERGNRCMSIEHLIQFAKVFDCDITDILEMTENS